MPNVELPESKLSKVPQIRQYRASFMNGEIRCAIKATVKYGDDCGNGHNTLSITGDIYEDGMLGSCGCIHDEIDQYFPELREALPFHLCSTDGPMHYLSNTLFTAGDRDCWGLRKGEPKTRQTVIQFGDNPISHTFSSHTHDRFVAFLKDCRNFDFEVISVQREDKRGDGYKFSPQFTFGGYNAEWHECPFETEVQALKFLHALNHCKPRFIETVSSVGDGKEPELEAARHIAIWPDATLTQLQDRSALEARLPALLDRFKAIVESFEFTY